MSGDFCALLEAAVSARGSLLCVGLDPEPAQVGSEPDRRRLAAWCSHIIEQTVDFVCCYKPNFAFFEQFGPEGLAALQELRDLIPAQIPMLLDAKRGDIGSTAAAYARAAFEVWRADAITVNPYLGRDGIAPFLAYPGKTVFVLAQTSNPSAGQIQEHGVEPLYMHVVHESLNWGGPDQVAFVVGATRPDSLARVRAAAPDRWILAPGVGAQGGDLSAALAAGQDEQGSGIIFPVSRAVIGAADPREAARNLRDAIRLHRASEGGPSQRVKALSGQAALSLALHDAGCIRFGEFTLASGKRSPVYVDLRRAISHPQTFRRMVQALAEGVKSFDAGQNSPDLLGAVPYAAMPAAGAVALALGKPLIYPRKETKSHGTGQAIEGEFAPGQSVLLIEDVITTGGSILSAANALEAAGLRVAGVLVLVDREQGGRAALEERGYRLVAATTMRDILAALQEAGRIDVLAHDTVLEYMGSAQ